MFLALLAFSQNQFWKLDLLPKKPRIIWILGNILLFLFGVIRAFLVLLEDSLRIISET
jgi:hypothetical protein